MEANARQRIGIFSSFVLMIGYDGGISRGSAFMHIFLYMAFYVHAVRM